MQSPGINRLTERKRLQPLASMGLLLLCAIIIIGQASIGHSFAASRFSEHQAIAAYTVNGTVFNDYNQNGVQDGHEPGLNGIKISAYDASNKLVASTISATDVSGKVGQYRLNIADGVGPTRVQFSGFGPGAPDGRLAAFYPSAPASGANTPVVFVGGANQTVNLGLEVPAEYCQQNPNVVTSCYAFGDQSGKNPVLIRFPYGSSGDAPDASEKAIAVANQIGPTFGLAYRRSSDSLFAAAYMKRHALFAPQGNPGAIFLVSQANSDSASASATPFVSLPAGPNLHDSWGYYVDGHTAYDAVGKSSLGDLALSDDESTLYAMNLYDRKLYSIPLGIAPAAPVAGTPVSFTVPIPADCPDADTNFRPFALTGYEGLVYVGAVCSAETTQKTSDLHAYIFRFNPSTQSFEPAPIFEFGLDYPRFCSVALYDAPTSPCITQFPASWRPWTPEFHPEKTTPAQTQYTTIAYPEPMLTSIAFDDGNLVLGLRDRLGDQGAAYNPGPDGTAQYNTTTAGDLLRACLKMPGDLSAGWTLENNGSCGTLTTAGAGNGKGPGGGQYYYQEKYAQVHSYVPDGGVLQIPGLDTILHTTMDPTDNVNSGGTHATSNLTGAITNKYQIYGPSAPATFAKANGLGSLTALCQSAPVQVGSRIWLDKNNNGLQDADEPGIAGVTVSLYDGSGKPVSTTKTDASGHYFFAVQPYVSYLIRLDNPADYAASGPLAGLKLTAANLGSDATINSHATLPGASQAIGAANAPQIAVSPRMAGQNDYTLMAGFVPPAPALSVAIANNTINPQMGQPMQYTLTVSNASSAGTIQAGQPITFTFRPPSALKRVTAVAPDWLLGVDPDTNQVKGTYTGSYPITAGQVLSPILISGVPEQAVLAVNASANVSTPNNSSVSNGMANGLAQDILPALTATPTPATPMPTLTATAVPVTPTPATATATPTPTLTVTVVPVTPMPTLMPTLTVTVVPVTPMPTLMPTLTVTVAPTPRPAPTLLPTLTATAVPATPMPTLTVTVVPVTPVPTLKPAPTLLPTQSATPMPISTKVPVSGWVKVWVQTLDACQQALPGAVYVLKGNGLFIVRGPGQGEGHIFIGSANPCPISHGNCAYISTGCLDWDLPVPAVGTATYTIAEIVPPDGYVACLHRSGCRPTPEHITLIVNASGKVTAITQESAPLSWEGTSTAATLTDPALFFNSQRACGSGCCCSCRVPLIPIRKAAIIWPDRQIASYLEGNAVASMIAEKALFAPPLDDAVADVAVQGSPEHLCSSGAIEPTHRTSRSGSESTRSHRSKRRRC